MTTRFLVHPTPIGDVLLTAADDLVRSLHPVRDLHAELIGHERVALLPFDEDDPLARRCTAQLDEYFAGARREFEMPLDWDRVSGFTRAALQAVCEIPYGETAGYGEVAAMAGSPRAARAVGTACATTPFSIVVPVHRVVRADGSLGEYGGRPELKRRLLDLERAADE
ncbi:methylated-DNA--[protein]-cysteine S-methyltransferase [Microbacterium xanthum]|uniref:methylated-DNA--[protein]-cysteine S-methyltransferase n=1 Tax=Microbacterium xanthum TaxID=3079794 RepID=UPI002AD267E4|nr:MULTISPECIES: methylated-DNA--[protein]-cysteine S-methyltransferase [unclassified Microbacterium]MDZ8171987.1 methylated-DNA--[protein]-cysteine S-methyltransferase [Microbacterium sp. KSW-48]MDZ8199922.1 methylated-DNA--[protein]-cysteine S-methyltransferase [Microbacterium sp. SSW1-59]